MDSWISANPEYKLILLTRSSIETEIIAPIPYNFDLISRPYQADWVRLAILAQNGGIWVDSSFIMTRSVDDFLSIQEQEDTDGFQFFLDYFTVDPAFPYFENWFIAAGMLFEFIKFLNLLISLNGFWNGLIVFYSMIPKIPIY